MMRRRRRRRRRIIIMMMTATTTLLLLLLLLLPIITIIIMMMMIIIRPTAIIITIITYSQFKGTIRDGFFFFTISSLRREPSPTRTLKWPARNRVQITRNTSSAHHLQPAVCHLVRRGSSAIKFYRVEIAFILALFYWLKPLTDEGGEETGVPRENP